MKLFFDTEFTGLHQNTTLISIGIVALDGRLYNDKDTRKISYYDTDVNNNYVPFYVSLKNETNVILHELKHWLQQFDGELQIWSDCLAYDWVLFNQLFGGAQNIPSNINYIPMDICTSFYDKGIDPDISREDFIDNVVDGDKHNSLYDVMVIRECYLKLYHEKL